MKNPRTYARAALDRASALSVFDQPGGAALVPITLGGGQPLLQGEKTKGGDDEEPDALTKALQFLKFTDEEMARVTELVAAVASLATVVGWVGAAILTIKAVLSFLGVFGKEEDPQFKLLKAIGEKVQQIYAYLVNTNRKGLYEKTIDWRGEVSEIRNSLSNLALSRSQTNLDALVNNSKFLRDATREMLASGAGSNGDIPFMRSNYGYQDAYPATHWIAAAVPFFMVRSDGTPIDYRDANKEMATTIWDPGYYIDVMFEAIGVRIAAVASLEPAFRSTGYDRESLRELHAGIVGFLDRWNRSLFVTRIAGPLNPGVDLFSGGHMITINPFDGWGTETKSIPLGVVDPVSGMVVFEPHYNDGFALRRYSHKWSDGSETAYWVVDNYAAAVAKASQRQNEMMQAIRARCGINRLYALMHAVWSLIVGPIGSEFVELTDATFASGPLTQKALPEQLTLGIVGYFAGKPGKSYVAHRYFQGVIKKFRVPMARRADVSQIQLGYKLVVSVGGVGGTATVVFCEYSAPNSPGQNLPLFPSGTLSQTLAAPAAVVYDVVQSDVFSVDEEDTFERTGSVGNAKWQPYSLPGPAKQRLFLEPRSGAVRLQIDVTFEFDVQNADHPFLGYANVELTTLDAAAHSHGFIATVQILETVVAAVDNGSKDVVQEQLADSMTLHFASSFLVVDEEYFVDRDAGFAAMDKTLGGINERYVRAKALGPIDPIERVSRRAAVEQALVHIADVTLREQPEQMKVVMDRVQPRGAQAQVESIDA